jgi:spermidine synthase
MWFYETLYPDIKLGLKGKLIYKKKTPYQDLKIYETPRFGKVLVLDGVVQTTEKDEFIYHEMLTHPVLLAHPKPEKILIIGAGDGGVLREVLKHKKIKKVCMVEIDKAVISASQKYLPSISQGAFRDRRAKIIIDDGAKFIRETKEKFDIVIIDSPDPIGVAKVLFSKKFYQNIFSILKSEGMTIRQTGSTILQPREVKDNYKLLAKVFPVVVVQIAAIPTYIGGFFSFCIASKKINPFSIPYKKLLAKYNQLNLKTKYYNPQIHFASAKSPNYMEE